MTRSVLDTNILVRAVITPFGAVAPVIICRDPDDNHIIEIALAGNAEYVVSNDQDLLVLKEYETVRFVTVGEFLQILDAQSSPPESSEQSE